MATGVRPRMAVSVQLQTQPQSGSLWPQQSWQSS